MIQRPGEETYHRNTFTAGFDAEVRVGYGVAAVPLWHEMMVGRGDFSTVISIAQHVGSSPS